MKFVIFILLSAGASFTFAQSDTTTGLDGTLEGLLSVFPALRNATKSVEKVLESVSDLTKSISASDDASNTLSAVSGNIASISSGLKALSAAISDLSGNLTDVTDDPGALDELSGTGAEIQKSIEMLIRKLPFQRLLREIAQDFETDLDLTNEKTELKEAIQNVHGVTDFVIALLLEVTGLLDSLSAALGDLSAGIGSKIGDLDDTSAAEDKGVSSALDELSKTEAEIQKSIELLIRKLPFQRLLREIAQDFKTD